MNQAEAAEAQAEAKAEEMKRETKKGLESDVIIFKIHQKMSKHILI